MVRAIVHNSLSEHGSGKRLVGLLSRDIGKFGVKDKVVALDAQTDGELATDHGIGENIAVLLAVVGIELEGVDTEGDGGAEVRDPVGDLGGSVLVDVDPLADLGQDEDKGDADNEGGEDLGEVGGVGEVCGQGLETLDHLDDDGHDVVVGGSEEGGGER